MDHPYRYSDTDKEDVVNTRLSSLETKFDWLWKRGFLLVAALFALNFIFDVVMSWETKRSLVGADMCQDEVKMTNPRTFNPGILSASLACDHPRHKSTVQRREGELILICACR